MLILFLFTLPLDRRQEDLKWVFLPEDINNLVEPVLGLVYKPHIEIVHNPSKNESHFGVCKTGDRMLAATGVCV